MEKIDQLAMAALAVAVIAITLSSAAITWSISRTKTFEYRIAQLHEEVDILAMREAKIQAWLNAHGVRIE